MVKKISDIILIFIFLAVIFAFPIFTKLAPPLEISEYENRELALAPVYSAQSLLDGKYFSDWEVYLSDHIWKRDFMLLSDIKYKYYVLKRNVVNDVIIGEEVLLPYMEYIELDSGSAQKSEEMAKKLSGLSDFISGYGGKFIYIGIPEQYSALRDKYPDYLFNNELNLTNDENNFFSSLDKTGVEYINMRKIFSQKGGSEKYYLKTDHHFNIHGAYLTYKTLCGYLKESGYNVNEITEEELTFKRLENNFYGSRSRKLYNISSVIDKLETIEFSDEIPFARRDNGNDVNPVVFNTPASEEENVTYGLYMGGDIAECVISTNRDWLPDILIFGDSFTNAIETVLWTAFDEMRSIDLRHYGEMKIYDYIELHKPDIVICVRDDTAYLSFDGNGGF